MAKNRADIKDKLGLSDGDPIFGSSPKPKVGVGEPMTISTKAVNANDDDQIKRGRPTKERPKKFVKGDIKESDYKNDKYLPFSSSIRADLYLALKRIEYHDNTTVRKVLENALEMYLKEQPNSKKKLPEARVKKLKPLKTALTYYYERVIKAEEGQENE